MHATGFFHEHERPDRDNYVTINWENIEPGKIQKLQFFYSFCCFHLITGKENNFVLQPAALTYNTVYDYKSIMHYKRTDFTVTAGKETITPTV
jgi:choriolysin H